MSWTTPSWLLLAAAALALLPVAALLYRALALQQARVATALLWRRWLGAPPATGAARVAIWLLAGALAGIAAAGPRWGRPAIATAPGQDLAIALDVSDSMRCTDVEPSRLGQAVALLRSVLERHPPGSFALVAGGASAEPVVPLTPDSATVEARLADPELSRWVTPGSNLSVLLASAAAQLSTSASGRTILLVSDGEELDGDAAAMAAALRAGGTAIVTLSVGTTAGAPIPRRESGGRDGYVRGADGELVLSHAHPELLARIAGAASNAVSAASPAASRQLAEALGRATRGSQHGETPSHAAPLAVAAALLATASFLLWPWRRRAVAMVLIPLPFLAAAPAAPPTPALWQRLLPGSSALAARRGIAAVSHGAWEEAARDYAVAVALDPRNDDLRLAQAAALTLSGDRRGEAILAAWSGKPSLTETALFDLGTSRLLRGDREGAAVTLRRALALDPTDQRAWRNLQLALVPSQQGTGKGERNDPLASVRRDHLVRAAASAALQPLLLAGPAPASPTQGRDW